MNLCRCEKGHFYDKEKYAVCPHCSGGTATDDSLTTVFTEEVHPEPITSGITENVVTDDFPVAGIPAEMPTVGADSLGLDTPTVPLGMEDMVSSVPITEGTNEENDHTIGFFDDDFFGAPKSGTTQSVVKKIVNKVSTPCVGWLIALGGEHIGTDFRLKVGKNFIGRNSEMDIALTEDKSVSRERHAIVVYEPKEHLYLVQPGDSSSLVYKNNKVVLTPVTLEAYDMITVGDVNLLFMPLCGQRFNWSTLFEEMKKNK